MQVLSEGVLSVVYVMLYTKRDGERQIDAFCTLLREQGKSSLSCEEQVL
jgi:hypothetical protein